MRIKELENSIKRTKELSNSLAINKKILKKYALLKQLYVRLDNYNMLDPLDAYNKTRKEIEAVRADIDILKKQGVNNAN